LQDGIKINLTALSTGEPVEKGVAALDGGAPSLSKSCRSLAARAERIRRLRR
jgi:hypothetical protein